MTTQGITGLRQGRELIEAGRFFFERGWVPATSGNFSARLGAGRILITVSGRHKGRLGEQDLMEVDGAGNPADPARRSSAETLLHTALYRRWPEVGAVLHTHSPFATVLSRRLGGGELRLAGYEVLKAFPGIDSHDSEVAIPVFPNDQEIPRLAAAVDAYLDAQFDAWLDARPAPPGYLIAGHGLYTWGRDVAETVRHIEAFEFLFECEWRTLALR